MPRKKRPKPPVGAAKFTEAEQIGEGAFGKVCRMRDITTQEVVAVKELKRGPQINKYVLREMINHKRLLHRNIISFREVFLTDSHISVVMEHAAGGDLFGFVQRYKKEQSMAALPEAYASFFFNQILCGVSYMHQKGMCHRDLKLENILLNAEEPPVVKICDFGFSKSMKHSIPQSFVGTTCYCAPEILQAKTSDEPYSGEMSDVWSVGVILYLLVVGDLPFGANDKKSALHVVQSRVVKGEYTIPPGVELSQQCRSLLSAILEVDPNRRISLDGIWEHPWMAQNGYQKIVLEDEGAMSPQTDESITSMCLEAMNQDDEDFVPPVISVAGAGGGGGGDEGGNDDGAEGGDSDDADNLFDEAEFSDLIHLATDMPTDAPVDDADISDMIRMTSDMSVDQDGAGGAALSREQQQQQANGGPTEAPIIMSMCAVGGVDSSSPMLEPDLIDELTALSPGSLGGSPFKPDPAWEF